jgi:hypothetical protein
MAQQEQVVEGERDHSELSVAILLHWRQMTRQMDNKQWVMEDNSGADSCGKSRWQVLQQERATDNDNTSNESGHWRARQEQAK